jgi:Ca2+-binding EF-hand superfamily protein
LKKAYDTFQNIDVNKNNQINASDIEKHFGSYSSASAKIMMREIDLDKDNIITFN